MYYEIAVWLSVNSINLHYSLNFLEHSQVFVSVQIHAFLWGLNFINYF